MCGMIAGSFIGGRAMDKIGRKWGKAFIHSLTHFDL